MDRLQFLKDVLFVVVVYERRLQTVSSIALLAEMSRLANSSANIFVYDNSSISQRPVDESIFYVHNPTNAGVARAYNVASDFAVDTKKKWMCLLDQDTYLTSELLDAYAKAVALFDEQVFVPIMMTGSKIVSPYSTFLGKGTFPSHVAAGIQSFDKYKVINSGLLIRTDTFLRCGGYDEAFPLDYSDVVFCNRLRSVVSGFVVIESTCRHELSATADENVQRTLERFQRFVIATLRYSVAYGAGFSKSLVLATRTIRLSLRFRSLSFVHVVVQSLRQY